MIVVRSDVTAKIEDRLAGRVRDELMFADDANFALDEADLRRLLGRLHQP